MKWIVAFLVPLLVTTLALACEEEEEETGIATPSPAITVTATPQSTPSGEATPTPEATPVEEETPTPAEEETPTPVEEETPTPVEEETPTPVEEETPTPVGEGTVTPIPFDFSISFLPSVIEIEAAFDAEVGTKLNVELVSGTPHSVVLSETVSDPEVIRDVVYMEDGVPTAECLVACDLVMSVSMGSFDKPLKGGGSYTITVTGTGGGVDRSTTLWVKVVDTQGPEISDVGSEDWNGDADGVLDVGAMCDEYLFVGATVDDPSGVKSVELKWTFNGGSTQSKAMESPPLQIIGPETGRIFESDLPSGGGTIDYWIEAVDNMGNGSASVPIKVKVNDCS